MRSLIIIFIMSFSLVASEKIVIPKVCLSIGAEYTYITQKFMKTGNEKWKEMSASYKKKLEDCIKNPSKAKKIYKKSRATE